MRKPYTQFLPVALTEEEIKVKGEQLAKKIDAHTKVEEEKKQTNSEFTKKLKESSAEIRHLARQVETGQEYRDVPVRPEFFPSKNLCKLYREDTGELVGTRPMTSEEYQQEFFDDEEDVILEEKEK